ncbi:MAG: 1-acyl-sn-glycerol-3-phosphate acyltransferase, partial [Nitrospirae bacterium]|nr:1-acyl-sn-glycerol-3-phosphate acyltransferase [Nitrospirota bacterium]
GPYIITPNHTSYLDGFIIASALPLKAYKNLYFLGFQRYFTGGIRTIIAKLGHVIPMDTETFLADAMQTAGHLIDRDKALCIFPEGGRSFNGEIMEFKKGVSILASTRDTPVVPALIRGAFEALPRGAKFVKPAKITVVFGMPIKPSDIAKDMKSDDVDRHQFFMDELKQIVSGLDRLLPKSHLISF